MGGFSMQAEKKGKNKAIQNNKQQAYQTQLAILFN